MILLIPLWFIIGFVVLTLLNAWNASKGKK